MKRIQQLTFLSIFSAFFFLISPSNATIMPKSGGNKTVIEQQNWALKKEFKAEKRLAKMEQWLKKINVDLNHPVDKWMWFWILCWGASILFSAARVFPLAGLLGLAGTICLVIWLIKLYS